MQPNIPQAPRNIPKTLSGNESSPNISNTPGGFEQKENSAAAAISRSQSVRQATGAIINTREGFVKFLNDNGLDLLTSAVKFQKTGDFIYSSIIIHTNSGGQTEPLSEFLTRYPQLTENVEKIRDSLSSSQSNMNVIS